MWGEKDFLSSLRRQAERLAYLTTASLEVRPNLACGFAVLIFSLTSIQSSHADAPFVLYGNDDRREVFEEKSSIKRTLARSVAAVFAPGVLKKNRDGSYSADAVSYRSEYNLCETERFAEQSIASDCSAFLIAPDVVATASHCIIDEWNCSRLRFAFDYGYMKLGQDPNLLPAENVYRCDRILSMSDADNSKRDFAIVKLDREVTSREPLKLRTQGMVNAGEELFVIGHPSGLPMKIASRARVREVLADKILANLDTYAGNSGSPIFNAKTYEVEGLLVSGEQDFVKVGSCNISRRCDDHACRGEEVMPIGKLLPLLPN